MAQSILNDPIAYNTVYNVPLGGSITLQAPNIVSNVTILYRGYTGTFLVAPTVPTATWVLYADANGNITSHTSFSYSSSTGLTITTPINKVTITAPSTSATLTLASGSTLATSGAFSITLTATATTNVTLPAGGTLLSTTGARVTSTPSNPTGTTDTSGKMMGLAVAFTPVTTTSAWIQITGQMANSTINDGSTIQLRYGTGAAPSNAGALTGTTLGAANTTTSLVAADKHGFCIHGIATGLTPGTAYWADVSLAAVTGGTATCTNLTAGILEC